MSIRQTKIVATLGPQSSTPAVIGEMIDAGVDMVRLNLSHGSVGEHVERARLVRQIAEQKRRTVAIMADLQGPKIRIERFREKKITLAEGQTFILDAEHDPLQGDNERVGLGYPDLPGQVVPGKWLLLDDGRVVLEVVRVVGAAIHCRVVVGGPLSDRKGINLQGGGLSAPALTADDREKLAGLKDADPDYVAISFVSKPDDVEEVRRLLVGNDMQSYVVAKLERKEAIEPGNLETIISASDAIMIARGDLGVEIDDARLPGVQRHILRLARALNRPVITATQMMESMIDSPIPTRAEVIDVANAVSGGTDAVMLSAETATGKHPAKVVAKIGAICLEAELLPESRISPSPTQQYERIDQVVSTAAMYAATHSSGQVKAVLAFTTSGLSTLWMSRITTDLPIYALTPYAKTRARVGLFRGVHPIEFEVKGETDHVALIKRAIGKLVATGQIHEDEWVLVAKGTQMEVRGGTNMFAVYHVGDVLNGVSR